MTSRKHAPWARRLSADWQRKGTLTTCEIRFDGCTGTEGLAPCHSLDRDEILTEEQFGGVVAGCQHCHFIADRKMPKDERLRMFKEIIANRIDYAWYGA